MKRALLITLTCLLPFAAQADVTKGISSDPLGELNTLYGNICKWTDGETIPVQNINLTRDGKPDYLLSYDLSCRGQKNAFAGEHGLARQIWVSAGTDYIRILDANARDLKIETRRGDTYIILQHAGSYCRTADAAPCFVTLIFKDNALVLADFEHQHPSMQARMRLEQEEQKND